MKRLFLLVGCIVVLGGCYTEERDALRVEVRELQERVEEFESVANDNTETINNLMVALKTAEDSRENLMILLRQSEQMEYNWDEEGLPHRITQNERGWEGAVAEVLNESDYRFAYALVKRNIYGVEHYEAFDLLRKSAEMAIDSGKARYLLDRMNHDKETDLWKLAHGHSRSWNSVIRALRRNDKSKLYEH